MRALLTGASGMLGEVLYRLLLRNGVEVEAWSGDVPKTVEGLPLRILDLRDPGGVSDALNDVKVDLSINCAAVTDADSIEDDDDDARVVNAIIPGMLAAHAARAGARFIHVSTDAVYDGERPGFRNERERINPTSAYAKTKAQGERYALEMNREAVVLRTTMIGWTPRGRRKFLDEILDHLIDGEPLFLPTDVIFSPLYTGHLASIIVELAEKNVRGVLNVGADRPTSKHELGTMVAEKFHLDPAPLRPVELADIPSKAPRVRNTALKVDLLSSHLGRRPPTVGEGVGCLAAEGWTGWRPEAS